MLASLRPANSVQALVLLPSRELATQVARVARRLAAGSPGRCLCAQRRWCKTEPLLHALPPLPPQLTRPAALEPQSAAVLSEELPLAARW